MRNEFESLDDFIKQYSIYPDVVRYLPDRTMNYYGLEFVHNGKYYRLSRGPIEVEEAPVLAEGQQASFEMAQIITDKNTYPANRGYRNIGWYKDLQDVLANCFLDGESFKNIISNPDTEVVGQD